MLLLFYRFVGCSKYNAFPVIKELKVVIFKTKALEMWVEVCKIRHFNLYWEQSYL